MLGQNQCEFSMFIQHNGAILLYVDDVVMLSRFGLGLQSLGVDSSLGTYMMSMGYYETKPLIYMRFVKENKCKRINGMLENGLKYLYCAF